LRVVSLTCSNTEIVAALGLGHLLVGVDDHSDHPPELLQGLPRVGPDLGIDVQAVAQLKPDLVLASLTVPGHDKVVDSLKAAGLPLLVPAPISVADMLRDVRDIASALGHADRGEALAAELQAGLQPLPPLPRRPSILVEWWPKPVIVPGRDSWVTQLLELAGARNPLADDPCESRAVSDEEVTALAPDASVICWCGVPFERYRPDVVTRREGWASTPALQKGQVHCVPEAWLGRPGPRLVEGLAALRRVAEAAVAAG
jgi:iron complex transport system substrate-binding protein